MKKYPKTLAAVAAEEMSSWEVAFALLAEVRTNADGRVLDGEWQRITDYLAEKGYERNPVWLRRLHRVARWSDTATREGRASIRKALTAVEAGLTPDQFAEEYRENESLRAFHRRITGRPWAPNAEGDRDDAAPITDEEADRLVEDRATASRLERAIERKRTKQREDWKRKSREHRRDHGPPPDHTGDFASYVDMESHMTKVRFGLNEALKVAQEHGPSWPEERRQLQKDSIAEVKDRCDLLIEAIDGVDIDAELTKLLDGGA